MAATLWRQQLARSLRRLDVVTKAQKPRACIADKSTSRMPAKKLTQKRVDAETAVEEPRACIADEKTLACRGASHRVGEDKTNTADEPPSRGRPRAAKVRPSRAGERAW